jgi:hypothetical protein
VAASAPYKSGLQTLIMARQLSGDGRLPPLASRESTSRADFETILRLTGWPV